MQSLQAFLKGSDVGLRYKEVTLNGKHTSLIAEPWAAKHYACEVHGSNGDRPVTAIVGSDNGPPELPDVLDVIAAEAAIAEEARGFEAWAEQMGFDPDSRRAERVYRRTRRQAKLLRALLGDEAYERLLWQTERL